MMSEKRFVCIDVGYGDDWYITDNGKRLSEMEIVDLLNEQQATIEQLQDLCGESDGENAKLRIENKRLEEENEQLQKTIKEVIELLLEEVDLFSDKATEHDIIPYKEMNEFDNKDAYYMCVSTKKAIKMLQRCL